MGNYCCSEEREKKNLTLLLVGLDNAGKTKTANGLVGDRATSPVPTVGFSVLNLKYLNYSVKIFDLGGGPNIRGIWYKYFVDAHGLIFVIDSSDSSRFAEVKMVLEEILYSDKITGKPILILANKQDEDNAVDEIEIIEYLNLELLVNSRKCPTLVQSCSASESNANKLDLGVQKGYNWIIGYIDKNYDSLNNRVEKDVHEQEIKDKQELLEKIQRIKSIYALKMSKQNEDAIETYSDYVRKMNGEATVLSNEILPTISMANFDKVSASNSTDTSASSAGSSGSFPSVYVSNTYTLTKRPKSAVECIKHQLQLSESIKARKSKSNKTTPMHLYGTKGTRSARERPKKATFDRRNLKSADNALFTISAQLSNDINIVDSSGDHVIDINHFGAKLPPIKNSVPWIHRPNMEGDGLSMVDI